MSKSIREKYMEIKAKIALEQEQMNAEESNDTESQPVEEVESEPEILDSPSDIPTEPVEEVVEEDEETNEVDDNDNDEDEVDLDSVDEADDIEEEAEKELVENDKILESEEEPSDEVTTEQLMTAKHLAWRLGINTDIKRGPVIINDAEFLATESYVFNSQSNREKIEETQMVLEGILDTIKNFFKGGSKNIEIVQDMYNKFKPDFEKFKTPGAEPLVEALTSEFNGRNNTKLLYALTNFYIKASYANKKPLSTEKAEELAAKVFTSYFAKYQKGGFFKLYNLPDPRKIVNPEDEELLTMKRSIKEINLDRLIEKVDGLMKDRSLKALEKKHVAVGYFVADLKEVVAHWGKFKSDIMNQKEDHSKYDHFFRLVEVIPGINKGVGRLVKCFKKYN